MRRLTPLDLIAGALFPLGLLITEIQLYQGYATDPSYLMNLDFVVGVLLAGFVVLALLLLLTGHGVGAGVTASLVGASLVVILLRSADARYFLPPFLEIGAGVFAVIVYGTETSRRNRALGRPQ